jgi:hypothetical protein
MEFDARATMAAPSQTRARSHLARQDTQFAVRSARDLRRGDARDHPQPVEREHIGEYRVPDRLPEAGRRSTWRKCWRVESILEVLLPAAAQVSRRDAFKETTPQGGVATLARLLDSRWTREPEPVQSWRSQRRVPRGDASLCAG